MSVETFGNVCYDQSCIFGSFPGLRKADHELKTEGQAQGLSL